jgi:predicted GNAT family N-acyltransferase
MDVLTVQTEAELQLALAVRCTVFVEEQRVPPELEVDEFDALGVDAVHALALLDGRAVAAGRLRVIEGEQGKLERMAVLSQYRERGTGRALTLYLEKAAWARGLRRLQLHAQAGAIGFYERLGYVAHGARFFEAGIEHQAMNKALGP